MADFFWFSDDQWSRIEPLLPVNGKGARRVEDRRVLSGSSMRCNAAGAGRLPGACLWSQKDALQPLRALGRARSVGGHLQRAGRSRRRARPAVHRQHLHQGPPDSRRRKRGGAGQWYRPHPRRQELEGPRRLRCEGPPSRPDGNPRKCARYEGRQACIAAMPPSAELVGDKGYDGNDLRAWLAGRGTAAVIPPRRNRKLQLDCDPAIYRQRDVIERMFCRFKDWRRVATRFDRNIKTFMATIAIAATVIWWLK